MEHPAAEIEVLGHQSTTLHVDAWDLVVETPCPRVAEPERRDDVQLGSVRTGIADRDPYKDVLRVGLRVVGRDLPVPVAVEDASVEELVLRIAATSVGVLVDELCVGILALGIHVAPPHPGVSRRRVEVEPVLLDVLAVISLLAGETEESFLEDRVFAVPKRKREAEPLPVVADPRQAVLVPAIDPRASVFVGKEVPRIAVFAVVLTDGAPGSLAEVRAPAPPRRATLGDLEQAVRFGCHRLKLTPVRFGG